MEMLNKSVHELEKHIGKEIDIIGKGVDGCLSGKLVGVKGFLLKVDTGNSHRIEYYNMLMANRIEFSDENGDQS